MYVLTHNDQVFLGPMGWNARMFQSVILDDYNRKVTIPMTNTTNGRLDVDANIVIRPVVLQPKPAYNSKIQGLNGPFYAIQQDKVLVSYVVVDLPVDAVKNTLKAAVTAVRYTKEVSGFVTTIQNTQVFIPTDRASRGTYFTNFQQGYTNVKWKFSQGSIPNVDVKRRAKTTIIPETWVVLTNTDFESIAQQIAAHVTSTFDWEHTTTSAIDVCNTLDQLNSIVITP